MGLPFLPPQMLRPCGFSKPAAFALDPTHPLNRGLVGYWPLGYNKSGKVSDYSGNSLDGTFSSAPTIASSHHGGTSLDFAASSSVSIPDNPRLRPAASTVMCWVYFNSISGANYTHVLFKQATSGPATTSYGVWVQQTTNKFYTEHATAGFLNALTSTTVATTGQWYLFGTTFGAGAITVNLNGKQENSASVSGANLFGNFAFTFATGPFNLALDGRIEGMRFYDRVVTPSEFAWLFAEPYAGLVPVQPQYAAGRSGFFSRYYYDMPAGNRMVA